MHHRLAELPSRSNQQQPRHLLRTLWHLTHGRLIARQEPFQQQFLGLVYLQGRSLSISFQPKIESSLIATATTELILQRQPPFPDLYLQTGHHRDNTSSKPERKESDHRISPLSLRLVPNTSSDDMLPLGVRTDWYRREGMGGRSPFASTTSTKEGLFGK